MPKISIITPIYIDIPQKADWLNQMVQSVISQTLADWELILIDDKSPLSLSEIRSKYSDDKRLRWLENATNEGPARTRNTAVALAQSPCILPLDSDDMLANSEALEYMYDTWIMDKTKTIYGNVQLYKPTANGFERSKIHQLAHYSFEGAMNLQFGIMPVTTMHSKEAHQKAGGWKANLEHGREDLEYWIACGKAGFCGHKINHTTLLYRKHEQSRDYRLKFELKELSTMQQRIKSMHSDVYQGRFPMGCCGGKGKTAASVSPNVDPLILATQNQAITKITELPGYDEKDLEWVSYQGPKKGRFDILARGAAGLPKSYTILGTGHCFQVHKGHHNIFSERQHLHFRVNQPDPRQNQEPEPVIQPEPQVIEVPQPKLSTLVRLDNVGGQTREVEIVSPVIEEVLIEPNPAQTVSSFIDNPQMPSDHLMKQPSWSLEQLGLSSSLTATLDKAGYTVEELTDLTAEKLAEIKGIGIKRGEMIVAKAKELMNNE